MYSRYSVNPETPYHFFERLKERKCYKLRIGDYRVIAGINEGRIGIVLIGHRKNIYEQL